MDDWEGFLCSTFVSLQAMKSETSISSRVKPYMYDFFKIHPFYQKSAGNPEGTLHKLFNSVIEGLNKEKQLPYFIMFVVDRDIVLQTDHFKPGIIFVLEKQLDWIFREVD